jgi:hypothetical protein
MISATRRLLMGTASSGLIASGFRSASATVLADRHAAGLDVAPAPQPLALIPRKPVDAPPLQALLAEFSAPPPDDSPSNHFLPAG